MEEKVSIEQIRDFEAAVKAKGYNGHFVLKSIFPGDDLTEGIRYHLNRSIPYPGEPPLFPFHVYTKAMISSPDKPAHHVDFLVNTDPVKGLKIESVQIHRDSCYEGAIEASFTIPISSMKDVPTKKQVNQMLTVKKSRKRKIKI